MANKYANKVIVNNETIIDLTEDTISADKILSGYTAHDASGAAITGTVVTQKYYTGSSNPSSSLGTNGDLYLKV